MKSTADDMASLLAWWREAGVTDCVAAAPQPWITPKADNAASAPAVAPAAPVFTRPIDLPSFIACLSAADQPDAAWPGALALPRVVANAPLLVLSDMPDMDAEPGLALDATHGALLDAMLRAIGMAANEVSFATLALRRPAGGLIDETAMPALAARTCQLLGILQPRRLILLGDQTARALAATNGVGHDHVLRAVNHDGGTVDALLLPHLMLLAQKSRLKARSWSGLRHLKEPPG